VEEEGVGPSRCVLTTNCVRSQLPSPFGLLFRFLTVSM